MVAISKRVKNWQNKLTAGAVYSVDEALAKVKENGKLNELHEKWVSAPLPEFLVEGE